MPIELKHPKKGLKNIKNSDQKCFLWCHIRHINRLKEHPERITNIDRKIACNLNYDKIKFSVEEKYCFICYENEMVFPIHVSDKKFEDSLDLLLLIDDNKSHYVYN